MLFSLALLSTFAYVEQQSATSGISEACQEGANATTSASSSDSCSSSEMSVAMRALALVALMCYVAAYSFGFGPVTWLILSEIFPASVKGTAMSVATSVNWASNLVISATFLRSIRALTMAGVFSMYCVVTLLATLFVFAAVPETKDKTLLRISRDLQATTFAERAKAHWRDCPCAPSRTSATRSGPGYAHISRQRVEVAETDVL